MHTTTTFIAGEYPGFMSYVPDDMGPYQISRQARYMLDFRASQPSGRPVGSKSIRHADPYGACPGVACGQRLAQLYYAPGQRA